MPVPGAGDAIWGAAVTWWTSAHEFRARKGYELADGPGADRLAEVPLSDATRALVGLRRPEAIQPLRHPGDQGRSEQHRGTARRHGPRRHHRPLGAQAHPALSGR